MSHPHPYAALPPENFWKTGVFGQNWSQIEQLYTPKFPITTGTRIMTAGSCFAQHIGRALRQRGFTVLDGERAPKPLRGTAEARAHGYEMYSARYGNVYTARQLRQLVGEALGRFVPGETIWRKGEKYVDALRPNVEPEGLDSAEEVQAHRAQHLRVVRKLLENADLLVFTFGLTEAWQHTETGTVFPIVPGTSAGGEFDPARHSFVNLGFAEVHRDFVVARAMIRKLNPRIRFLVTVSPVPLAATASGQHVLPATIHSKSVLRAVAGSLAAELEDVDYFPSYELISAPFSRQCFYDPANLRDVAPEAVEMVMSSFLRAHAPAQPSTMAGTMAATRPAAAPAPASPALTAEPAKSQDDVVCEEMLLEAFRK